LRLGSYIKFIPYPVTVGFISGIAIILFAGQIHDLLGLTLAGKEPPDFIPKVEALSAALGTVNSEAGGVERSPRHRQLRGRRRCACHDRDHRRPQTPAAHLAGYPARGGARSTRCL